MLKALLLDFGGTLDSDGIAWPERFYSLYLSLGLKPSREEFSKAFYAIDDSLAERVPLRGLDLEATVSRQVSLVVDLLAPGRPELAQEAARRFVADSRGCLRRNRPLLLRLKRRFRLGIVSNFYGNLESILAGEGYLELFDAVAESASVGAMKPDPAIFEHALKRLGAGPEEAAMVGDSLPRDMRGAEGLGMAHAWLRGGRAGEPCCPKAVVLNGLGELEAAFPDAPAVPRRTARR